MNYAKADHQHPKPIAVVGGGGPATGALKVKDQNLMVYREGHGWVPVVSQERIVQVELSPLKTCDGQAISRMVNNVLHRENTLSPVDVHCKGIVVSRPCFEHLLTDEAVMRSAYLAANMVPQLQIMGYPVREDTTLDPNTILIVLT
jgi:hypothetical protein